MTAGSEADATYGWRTDMAGEVCRELVNPTSLDQVEQFLAGAPEESTFEVERTLKDRLRIDAPEFVAVNRTYGHGETSIWLESNRDDYSFPVAPADIVRLWEIPEESEATLRHEDAEWHTLKFRWHVHSSHFESGHDQFHLHVKYSLPPDMDECARDDRRVHSTTDQRRETWLAQNLNTLLYSGYVLAAHSPDHAAINSVDDLKDQQFDIEYISPERNAATPH